MLKSYIFGNFRRVNVFFFLIFKFVFRIFRTHFQKNEKIPIFFERNKNFPFKKETSAKILKTFSSRFSLLQTKQVRRYRIYGQILKIISAYSAKLIKIYRRKEYPQWASPRVKYWQLIQFLKAEKSTKFHVNFENWFQGSRIYPQSRGLPPEKIQ